jgi:hypothetical protein
MDQVRFAFVQRGNPLLKLRIVEIDVGRSGDMACGEFVRRANVEHDYFFVFFEQLRRLVGIDVLN